MPLSGDILKHIKEQENEKAGEVRLSDREPC